VARSRPAFVGLTPHRAVEGGRVRLDVSDLEIGLAGMPSVTIGGAPAEVAFASSRRLTLVVPDGLAPGSQAIALEDAPGASAFLEVGRRIATGFHQVDSPAIDREGRIYVTYSGPRGQQSSVSVYRIGEDGLRDIFVTGITNATSMAFDPQGRLHVSSRFDGTVSRIDESGHAEVVASDLGVACGLAFDGDGVLFVGDRSGTIFRVGRSGGPMAFASLPSSVAAYHVAWNPADGALYVTAPTLATRDVLYRVGRQGDVSVVCEAFGRPQGLAIDAQGTIYVAEALAGASGIYRVRPGNGEPECLVAGPAFIGVALHPRGGFVVSTAESLYRIE
jgi:sugar lactone lactonase YvrE